MNQTQDPVGYRRGLVLGLTLAETLLLILFLLLLVYTTLLQTRERVIVEQDARLAELNVQLGSGLTRLVDTLTQGGSSKLDPHELSLRLERLTQDMARLSVLEDEVDAYQRIVSTPEEATRIADAFNEYKIPLSPQQVLDEQIAQAEAAEGSVTDLTNPHNLNEPEAPTTLNDALAALDRMSGQLAYFQRIADSKEGNGLTLPPCWQRNSQIVYTYDALLLDSGLRLSINDSRDGMDMAGMRANGSEPPIDSVISRQQFLERTRGMFEWSIAQRCRFYVRIVDGTSAQNKAGYKQTRTTVENHFYIRVAG